MRNAIETGRARRALLAAPMPVIGTIDQPNFPWRFARGRPQG
jgi:hypothetical protein